MEILAKNVPARIPDITNAHNKEAHISGVNMSSTQILGRWKFGVYLDGRILPEGLVLENGGGELLVVWVVGLAVGRGDGYGCIAKVAGWGG